MTTEQQEGNRVCAVYDGYAIKDFGVLGVRFIQPIMIYFPYYDWNRIEDLKYHSSFDSLNPVAKRVKEELRDYTIKNISTDNNSNALRANSFVQHINNCASEFDIAQLFPAVVRAVQFLNSINQKPK